MNAVSAGLFISAFGSCLVTICGVVYVSEVRLPMAQFTCPFTVSASCGTEPFCNYCSPGDTTPNKIIDVLKLPKCIANVSFTRLSLDYLPPRCFNLPCSESARQCLPSMEYLCGFCSQMKYNDILTVYMSIMMFPLAVLYMTCNLTAWRKQSSSEIPHSSLELKLGHILKWMSIANIFVKYLLASVLFFILVGYEGSPSSLLKCDAISGRTSAFETKNDCNPQLDRTLEVFVLRCCCAIFSCFLVFDVAIFSRLKLKNMATVIAYMIANMATVIACAVSFGCFIIIIICGIQIKSIFDLWPTYLCSTTAAGPQSSPNYVTSRFQCNQNVFQMRSGVPQCNCRVEFPTTVRAAASTLVLDVLFVFFDAVVYALACKQSLSVQPSLSGDYVSMKGL